MEFGLNAEHSEGLPAVYADRLRRGFESAYAEVLAGAPASDLDRAEALRYLTRIVAGGSGHAENSDPAYPVLGRVVTPWTPYSGPNPDFTYFSAPLDGRHEYRLFGSRASAHFLAFETFDGHMGSLGTSHAVDTAIHVVGDGATGGDFVVSATGEVDVQISNSAEGALRLAEGTGFLIVRYAFYDWENEDPPDIYIERLGAPYPPPPVTAESTERVVEAFCGFLETAPRNFAEAARRITALPPHELYFPPIDESADRTVDGQLGFPAFRNQYYGRANWQIEDGEAILLALEPPEAMYWGFHITNRFRESTDWHRRLTSINGFQAHLDGDGIFRAVISAVDPGTANWFDTGGRTSGLLIGRFNRAAHRPEATLTKLSLADLDKHIPSDTQRVSPAVRSGVIRSRMLAAHRRGDA